MACNQQTNSAPNQLQLPFGMAKSLLSFRSHNLLFGFVLVFIHLGNKDWEWHLNSHHAMSHVSTIQMQNYVLLLENWWTTCSLFHIHTCVCNLYPWVFADMFSCLPCLIFIVGRDLELRVGCLAIKCSAFNQDLSVFYFTTNQKESNSF